MPKTIYPVRFSARLLRPVDSGDWLFLRIPQDASDQMPARSMVSVEGTIHEKDFAGVLQPNNYGGHWLKIDSDWIAASGVRPGQDLNCELSPTKVEPEPEVPEDLDEALNSSPTALAVWQDTSAIARRDWITWMNQGKLAETRRIRKEKMLDMLSKGKRRVCCYDRSGMASRAFYCPIEAED